MMGSMEKEKKKLFCFYLLFVILIGVEVQGSHHHHHHCQKSKRTSPQKLFVFGDSYVDTGNLRKSDARSWKEPYGITFPGKPSGRWSDGRVLTDFFACFAGIKSPIAYKWRKVVKPKLLRYGMNYAYGGTGVFDTLAAAPNLTTQIDFFEQMIKEGVFTDTDVQTSTALVSAVGNDYATYQSVNGSIEGLPDFSASLIKQLTVDLTRISSLGVRKMAITGLQPFGCLPSSNNMAPLQQCNDTFNQASTLHNILLQQAVDQINNATAGPKVVILDLYESFLSVLQNTTNQAKWKLVNPLTPCCVAVNSSYECGSVDKNGKKMYSVCDKPESSFFWDTVHPTQTAWAAVSSTLRPTFHTLHSS